MSLGVITDQGHIATLTDVALDIERSAFRASNHQEGVSVFISYIHPVQNDVPYGDYAVSLFSRKDYSENDIYDIYDKATPNRIGMLFPLEALRSRAHGSAESERFLRFAQGAFHALCLGIDDAYISTPSIPSDECLDITEFYSEDTIVCIVHKPALGEAAGNFCIRNYLPSFFRYGYYLQSADRNPASMLDESKSQLCSGLQKRLNIEQLPAPLRGNIFLERLLRDILPYEQDPLLAFYYLYQIIELLIDQIMQSEYKIFVEKVRPGIGSTTELRDAIDKLQEKMKERRRINALVSEHINEVPPSLPLLRNECNTLINTTYKDSEPLGTDSHLGDYLYGVRNLLFHNLRSIDSFKVEMVAPITAALKLVTCEVLLSYRE